MAHTITLRAQGATRASVARLSSPVSSRACMYFISPCFPSAIQAGKTCNSPKSRTGAMPQRSNPASRADCLMRVGRSRDKWEVVRGQFSRVVHLYSPRGYHCGVRDSCPTNLRGREGGDRSATSLLVSARSRNRFFPIVVVINVIGKVVVKELHSRAPK